MWNIFIGNLTGGLGVNNTAAPPAGGGEVKLYCFLFWGRYITYRIYAKAVPECPYVKFR